MVNIYDRLVKFLKGAFVFGCYTDRVSVPSPIAIDMLMDAMARDRVPMY